MKILYVTASFPYGPGEAFICPELEGLRRLGHELRVAPLWPRGPLVHEEAQAWRSATVTRTHLGVMRAALGQAWRRPQAAGRLLWTMLGARTWRLQLKNLLAYPQGLWLAQYAAAWGADHIHVHWAATTATMGLVGAERSGIPWSFTAHRFDIRENNLLARKAASASFCRCISAQGAETVAALLPPGVPRPVVIHMGVQLAPRPADASERPERTPAAGGHELRVVMPANFIEVKGHRYLVAALGILSRQGYALSCDLAGAGPLHAEVQRLVAEAGLADRVHLVGVLPHNELLAGLAEGRWDVLVLPSIETESGVKEGIPVSLMEAMAASVPVISTSTGAILELLAGGAGLVVPQRDPEALATALRTLADHPEQREQLAQAGRKRIEEAYEVGAVVAQLAARFESAAAQARG
jgi:glycosyltransferase involved in cell wall biosynthesis